MALHYEMSGVVKAIRSYPRRKGEPRRRRQLGTKLARKLLAPKKCQI